jgi:hypothetical protein
MRLMTWRYKFAGPASDCANDGAAVTTALRPGDAAASVDVIAAAIVAARRWGLTLVHFSAQLKLFCGTGCGFRCFERRCVEARRGW